MAFEAAPVGDAPIKTLGGQDSEFGLSHIEPAAVLGRVVIRTARRNAAPLVNASYSEAGS